VVIAVPGKSGNGVAIVVLIIVLAWLKASQPYVF
jgi:hypothetical protein